MTRVVAWGWRCVFRAMSAVCVVPVRLEWVAGCVECWEAAICLVDGGVLVLPVGVWGSSIGFWPKNGVVRSSEKDRIDSIW